MQSPFTNCSKHSEDPLPVKNRIGRPIVILGHFGNWTLSIFDVQ
ncbi:3496_t:CDS:2, partial [Racocetra persica]